MSHIGTSNEYPHFHGRIRKQILIWIRSLFGAMQVYYIAVGFFLPVLLTLIIYVDILFIRWAASSQKMPLNMPKNAQIQIILHMCKVSSGPLISIRTFCSIQ